MDITFKPNSLNFIYTGTQVSDQSIKIFSNLSDILEEPHFKVDVYYNQIETGWLKIIGHLNEEINGDLTPGNLMDFKVRLNVSQDLPDGNYNATISTLVGNKRRTGEFEIINWGEMIVYLTVSAGHINFSVTPNFGFIHLQKNNPINPILKLSTETTSQIVLNGSNLLFANKNSLPFTFSKSQEIEISTNAITRNLDFGIYPTNLNFKNSLNNLVGNVDVKLLVTNDNKLQVLADELSWSIQIGLTTPEWKDITVFDPGNDVSIDHPDWIELVLVSTENNIKEFIVRANENKLKAGKYNSVITFTSGVEIRRLNVEFSILGAWDDSFQKSYHFTKDNELLKINRSSTDDSYVSIVELEMIISVYSMKGEKQLFTRLQQINFKENVASFDVGKYIHRLIKTYQNGLTSKFNSVIKSTGIYPQYQFAEVYFNVKEVNFKDLSSIRNFVIPTQYFVIGRSTDFYLPKSEILEQNQEDKLLTMFPFSQQMISKKGMFAYNFIQWNNSQLVLQKNGKNIPIPKSNSPIPQTVNVKVFGGVISLSDIQDVKIGDVLTLKYNDVTKNYIVIPDVKKSTNIYYLNQWGLLDVFEFRGGFKIDLSYTDITSSNFENWTDVSHKLSTSKVQKFTISTGKILEENQRIIDEIRHSQKCWIFDEHLGPVEMYAISSKMNLQDSEEYDIALDVEFELKNINDDQSIQF